MGVIGFCERFIPLEFSKIDGNTSRVETFPFRTEDNISSSSFVPFFTIFRNLRILHR